jgi:N-acetyl-anhydromuramyl-L-alanine amidase AmpD
MKGSEFVATLPVDPTPQREKAIFDAVTGGAAHVSWVPLTISAGGHEATVYVTEDVVGVGDASDWVRVNVNMTTAQYIADRLGAVLPTAKLSDIIFQAAAFRLTPCLQKPDAAMAKTPRMLRHHTEVEAKRAGRTGLVSTVGKDWVITDKLKGHPDRAANYGWHDKRAPNGKLWQGVGLAHNRFHVDYSQVLRLVRRTLVVDGVERDIVDVLRDSTLSVLISGEGPIETWRLEAVPENSDFLVAPAPSVPKPAPKPAPKHAAAAAAAPAKPATSATPAQPATATTTAKKGDGPYPLVQARNFKPANREQIDYVVIHSMEAGETAKTAENVAAWFAGKSAPMASAHYCIDSDSIVQCVLEKDVAYHAPGANAKGIGLEHAGYAKQSAHDWADPYSARMLERSAELTAALCRKYEIPVAFVDAAGLLAGERGITTHRAVSAAFRKSTHTDPGAHFPMNHYLELVLALS